MNALPHVDNYNLIFHGQLQKRTSVLQLYRWPT